MAGGIVLVYIVQRTGTASIGGYLQNLGLGILIPFLLIGVQHCLRALAWSFSVTAADHNVAYSHLLRARLGAEALGYLSFTGAVGSQASKVLLLREGFPARAGAAAVLVDAAASGIAGVVYVGASLLICQAALGLPAWMAAVGGALLGAAIGAWIMAGIWSGQRRDDLPQLPPLTDKAPSYRAATRDAMRRMRVGLVRLHGIPFALMIGIHLLGHVFLTAATWSILSMLDISQAPVVGLLFESGAKLGNTMGAVVPARLGVFEVGLAASAQLLGIDAAAGVAVGLVRRLVDILWVGVGLTLTTVSPIRFSGRPDPAEHDG